MAGSGFVHGAIGNGPVSMQAPPALQMPAPTSIASQKGLSCHGKRSTGYDSPFLGAGLDDNAHTGCTLEDEVQAYAMDDDPWAIPEEKPVVAAAPAISPVTGPAITEIKDGLDQNLDVNPAAALDNKEQSAGYNEYADMRLDDPFALPMRRSTRKDSLPELDNSTNASFGHHGMFW